MLIPNANAKKIRNYQTALFYQPTEPKSERMYVFYLLLRPVLLWVKELMIDDFKLERSEAESELYLLCCRLFNDYNSEKGTLVPYLSKHIPWKVNHLLRKLEKNSQREVPSGLITMPEEPYKLDEEYYWKIPTILFVDRYVGKLFTISQKYLISNIVIADDDRLTKKDLAESCGISRQTMTMRLLELKEALSNWRNNGTT